MIKSNHVVGHSYVLSWYRVIESCDVNIFFLRVMYEYSSADKFLEFENSRFAPGLLTDT